MTFDISEQEVRRIAHLARLLLSDEEAARFGGQLGSILHYMARLNELDTAGVEPMAHPLPLHNVFREDLPGRPLDVEQVLANAPDRQTPFFKVPKVLDQESA